MTAARGHTGSQFSINDPETLLETISDVARGRLGLESLRPGQADAVAALLQGHDALAVMPTGAGKSAIYQIAALLLDGPTVVVSPLVALQRDQVEAIDRVSGGASASVINAGVSRVRRAAALQDLERGEVEFILLAPEQLHNQGTYEAVADAAPSLFVVDEAHCISSWGHDFRPAYLRLGGVIESLGHPRVLALTATAAPPIREEIVARLGMRDPAVVVRGFDRPNIWLGARSFGHTTSKVTALLEAVTAEPKPGIIYAATRRHAEDLAEALRAAGTRAVCYHAGMSRADREAAQTAFMADDADVMVATTAFGMGVDKPNVRFVFHLDAPGSLDAYHQEIGRAGRDGAAARALLFYQERDLGLHRYFASGPAVHPRRVSRLTRVLQEEGDALDAEVLRTRAHLAERGFAAALAAMEEAGIAELLPWGAVRLREAPDPQHAARLAEAARARRRRLEQSRVSMVQSYASLQACRRAFLLNYFGEPFQGPCGACDNCDAGLAAAEPLIQPFPVNSQVIHQRWGSGMVVRYEPDDGITVLFDDAGYKTLSVRVVVEEGLLRGAKEP